MITGPTRPGRPVSEQAGASGGIWAGRSASAGVGAAGRRPAGIGAVQIVDWGQRRPAPTVDHVATRVAEDLIDDEDEDEDER
jgi:hypothetical protein